MIFLQNLRPQIWARTSVKKLVSTPPLGNVRESTDNGISHEKIPFVPRYMIELNDTIDDKHGKHRNSRSKLDIKANCFLLGIVR